MYVLNVVKRSGSIMFKKLFSFLCIVIIAISASLSVSAQQIPVDESSYAYVVCDDGEIVTFNTEEEVQEYILAVTMPAGSLLRYMPCPSDNGGPCSMHVLLRSEIIYYTSGAIHYFLDYFGCPMCHTVYSVEYR